MAQSGRGVTWDRFKPALTHEELESFERQGKIVLSASFAKIDAPDNQVGFLAIRFAFEGEPTQTVFLDEYAARVVGNCIDALNRDEWKATPPA